MDSTDLSRSIVDNRPAGFPLDLVKIAPHDERARAVSVDFVAASNSPFAWHRRCLVRQWNSVVAPLNVVSIDAGVPDRLDTVFPKSKRLLFYIETSMKWAVPYHIFRFH